MVGLFVSVHRCCVDTYRLVQGIPFGRGAYAARGRGDVKCQRKQRLKGPKHPGRERLVMLDALPMLGQATSAGYVTSPCFQIARNNKLRAMRSLHVYIYVYTSLS